MDKHGKNKDKTGKKSTQNWDKIRRKYEQNKIIIIIIMKSRPVSPQIGSSPGR